VSDPGAVRSAGDETTEDGQDPPRPARDREVRNELVTQHLGEIEYFVRRYSSRGVEADDLRQVCRVALILAAERFDPDVGVHFATFAHRTIEGECKRYLRDRSWAVRPPRSIQELYLEVCRQRENLTHELGRPPTVPELAAVVGQDEEHVLEALDATHARFALSLESPLDESGRSLGDQLSDPVEQMSRAEATLMVHGLVSHLSGRDRWIVEQRFFRRRTQPEIADDLGISQSYLSRVIKQILQRMGLELAGGGVRENPDATRRQSIRVRS
jgi:RNA polymerase sigma-B factor